MIEIKKILLPVDFSKGSDLAARFATSLAQEYKAKLHVLHVYDPLSQYDYMATEYVEDRKKKLEEANYACQELDDPRCDRHRRI
jgi:nucleotide-binding universal stress UspA family protein